MPQPHDEAQASRSNGEPIHHGADGPQGCRGGSAGPGGQKADQEVDSPERRSPADVVAAAVAGGDFPAPSVSVALLTSQV